MKRRFQAYRVPERCHPFVRVLFEEMNRQRLSAQVVAERSGVAKDSIIKWRSEFSPRLTNIEACLAVVGRKIVLE